MRALITGGAGFIGSHLAERLLEHGHHVVVIDNFDTGSLDNIRHLLEHPTFELVTESVLNEGLMEDLIRHSDQVYHLAAAVGVRRIIDQPLLSIRTNIRATEIVLEQASRFEKPVLIASTSEVYGKNDSGPLREDDDSIIGSTQITRWLYANTKATDEFLSLAYHRDRGLPVVIVRFFNTIGARQTGQYGMVVPRLVHQALREEPLTVYGDGRQTRCFTDVRDAVTAVLRLMETPAAFGQTFNIGNSREISIEALARTVIRMTGSRASIRYLPYEQVYERGFEDMRRRVPDVSKLRATVGFVPEIPLERALDPIIQHLRQRQNPACLAGRHPRAPVILPQKLHGPAAPALRGGSVLAVGLPQPWED
jgi:UDP-glucose 4-epimerase